MCTPDLCRACPWPPCPSEEEEDEEGEGGMDLATLQAMMVEVRAPSMGASICSPWASQSGNLVGWRLAACRPATSCGPRGPADECRCACSPSRAPRCRWCASASRPRSASRCAGPARHGEGMELRPPGQYALPHAVRPFSSALPRARSVLPPLPHPLAWPYHPCPAPHRASWWLSWRGRWGSSWRRKRRS